MKFERLNCRKSGVAPMAFAAARMAPTLLSSRVVPQVFRMILLGKMKSELSLSRYELKCSLCLVEMTVHFARDRKASMASRGMARRSGPPAGTKKSISTFFSHPSNPDANS